jgi:AraC-like DNA-binding protein
VSAIRHEPHARTIAWQVDGGDTIDRHRHDEHQLIYVSAGVLEVRTAEGSWVVSMDRAVWLPAGIWHEHRFFGPSHFHTVGFSTDRAPLPEGRAAMVAVSSLLRELLIACADPSLSPPEERRMHSVTSDQLRRSVQQPLSLPAAQDPRLAEACRLIAERPGRQYALADLAGRVGASERTLSRLFRQELGMSYPQWRTNRRLLDAAVLLSSGTPVTLTALRCGWSTPSSFIDAFRRAMGQTPGAYQKGAAQHITASRPGREDPVTPAARRHTAARR